MSSPVWGWQDICACLGTYLYVCLFLYLWVSLCVSLGKVYCLSSNAMLLCKYASMFVPVCEADSHLVCLRLYSHVSVFSANVRMCAIACAHLCPWIHRPVRLHSVGAPV